MGARPSTLISLGISLKLVLHLNNFYFFFCKKASSPYINHFLQPDTLIPGVDSPQSWNRFSYVNNNPIRFNDPTGHVCSDPDDPTPSCEGSGSYPTNSQGLGDSQVIIPGEPLDDGLKQKEPRASNSDNSPDELTNNVDTGIDTGLEIEFGLGVKNFIDWARNFRAQEFGNYTHIYGPSWANRSLGLPGRRYLTSNVTGYQAQSLIAQARNGGSNSFLLSLFANVIDAESGKFANTQEFAVSVTVDTALSYAVGVSASVFVAGTLAVLGVAAAPALAVGVAIIGVGLGIGWLVNKSGAPDLMKSNVNSFINSYK